MVKLFLVFGFALKEIFVIIKTVFSRQAKAALSSSTEKILGLAIWLLPLEYRNRFQEEWPADLRDVPGQARKFFRTLAFTHAACSILLLGREDSEHEQILIRIGFAALIRACLLLAPLAGTSVPVMVTSTSTFYLVSALLLLVILLRWPVVMPWRRYAGMVLDHVTLLIGIIFGGTLVAPLWPFFLWITIGMGFRYGPRYFFISAGLSIACIITVILTSLYWNSELTLSSFTSSSSSNPLSFIPLLAPFGLPAYAFWLRRRCSSS